MEQTQAGRRNSYKHRPLDREQSSLRLLKVLPDLSADGYIQCVLVQTLIGRAEYSCLSHKWGDPLPTHDILIEDEIFTIGMNLFDFLNMYHSKSEAPGYIWVDALCIDQANLQERNHQVAEMSEVYYNAQLVLVWLGRCPEIAPVVDILKNYRDPSFENYDVVSSSLLTCYLFNNKYWNRAWVVQETILAREVFVYMDDQRMASSILVERLRSPFLMKESTAFRNSAFHQYISDDVLYRPLAEQSLPQLMNRFRGKECSIPRDRVFSLLGLCSPSSRIAVDYGQTQMSLFYNMVAKQGDALCACDIVQILDTLYLTDINWDGAYVDIDMKGIQLTWHKDTEPARDLSSRPKLGLYGGASCPVLEGCILNIVRKSLDTSISTSQHDPMKEDMPIWRQPYIYRGLTHENSWKVRQACDQSPQIIQEEEDSTACTLRIALPLIICAFLQNPMICVLSGRSTTWRRTDAISESGPFDEATKLSTERLA